MILCAPETARPLPCEGAAVRPIVSAHEGRRRWLAINVHDFIVAVAGSAGCAVAGKAERERPLTVWLAASKPGRGNEPLDPHSPWAKHQSYTSSAGH